MATFDGLPSSSPPLTAALGESLLASWDCAVTQPPTPVQSPLKSSASASGIGRENVSVEILGPSVVGGTGAGAGAADADAGAADAGDGAGAICADVGAGDSVSGHCASGATLTIRAVSPTVLRGRRVGVRDHSVAECCGFGTGGSAGVSASIGGRKSRSVGSVLARDSFERFVLEGKDVIPGCDGASVGTDSGTGAGVGVDGSAGAGAECGDSSAFNTLSSPGRKTKPDSSLRTHPTTARTPTPHTQDTALSSLVAAHTRHASVVRFISAVVRCAFFGWKYVYDVHLVWRYCLLFYLLYA
jgi:hypothetical protein